MSGCEVESSIQQMQTSTAEATASCIKRWARPDHRTAHSNEVKQVSVQPGGLQPTSTASQLPGELIHKVH